MRAWIHGAHHVQRGYENIEGKFLDLGAQIEHVSEDGGGSPPMKIGIDLGTANVLVYVKGRGIVIQEPSVVAVSDDNQIVAVGEQAREMIGRTPGNITAIRPMKDGVIADYVITEAMLRYFIKKAGPLDSRKPDVMISVPVGRDQRREARRARRGAEGRRPRGVPDRGAAGRRDRCQRADQRPVGNMIIDIGGGTSEIAVIALGGIVVSTSVRVGGNRFDEAIANYIRKKYNLMIGERTAEEVKMADRRRAAARARAAHGGARPRPHRRPAANDPADQLEVMEAIESRSSRSSPPSARVLEKTPPELSSDIIDKGMVMSGGGSMLRNIDKLLTQVTGVPCHVAENPLNCVAVGTGLALEHFEFFKKSLVQKI